MYEPPWAARAALSLSRTPHTLQLALQLDKAARGTLGRLGHRSGARLGSIGLILAIGIDMYGPVAF